MEDEAKLCRMVQRLRPVTCGGVVMLMRMPGVAAVVMQGVRKGLGNRQFMPEVRQSVGLRCPLRHREGDEQEAGKDAAGAYFHAEADPVNRGDQSP